MRRLMISGLLTTLLTVGLIAQQKAAAWTEWSKGDAEKILNDSPWAQTQVETDTSEMTYSPTNGGGTGNRPNRTTGMRDEQSDRNRNRAAEGAYNQAVETRYRIRFLSARPIREALANLIVQQQSGANADEKKKQLVRTEMQQFVERDFRDFIVVTVTFEANDGRLTGKAFQEFGSAVTDKLRNNTYLERNDGQRVFLIDYRVPTGDGLGARFIFPRTFGGHPFLNGDSREVRFYSEVGTNTKLNRRFKVSDMFYQGKLEY
jgi:hypothetical protein